MLSLPEPFDCRHCTPTVTITFEVLYLPYLTSDIPLGPISLMSPQRYNTRI